MTDARNIEIRHTFGRGRTGVSTRLTEERNYIQLRYLYDESEAVHAFDETIWIAGWRGIGSTQ